MITIVFPFDSGELFRDLDGAGVKCLPPSDNMRYDDEYCRVAIDLLTSPYVLPSLSTIIVAYLRRNVHKKAVIKSGDKEVILSGLSANEIKSILNENTVISIVDGDQSPVA